MYEWTSMTLDSLFHALGMSLLYAVILVLGFFVSYGLGKRYLYETWFHKRILKLALIVTSVFVVIALVSLSTTLFMQQSPLAPFQTMFLYFFTLLLLSAFFGGLYLPIHLLRKIHDSFRIKPTDVYSLPTLRRRIKRELAKNAYIQKEKKVRIFFLKSGALYWIIFLLMFLA